MGSSGAAFTATRRGNRLTKEEADNDYQVILPRLPTGPLQAAAVLEDVTALGAHHVNHLCAMTMSTADAGKKLTAFKEQVKLHLH
ncbi:hypothetical protein HPB50_010032 [Hyalomma asiaticum]|uniref:Uncharacterized protein n=1 Tax=Hyalomma asiaticum TaxID=266040 RepID=A0ACB7SE32_HYAAI|nr:hypothetical protein HPB50_010032 [Hyalomma asiaticum]